MPNSTKQVKAIVVGANSPCCDSVRWSEINLKNFVDYDVAILIVRDLKSDGASLNLDILSSTGNQLRRLLKSGGSLTVVTPGVYPFSTKHSPQNAVEVESSISVFLPIPVSFRDEAGDTVTRESDVPFAGYLRRIKSWKFWASISGQDSTQSAYLSNREGKALAGFFAVGAIGLVLLPDVPELTTEEIALELLPELGFGEAKVPAPDWAATIPVPGLGDIDTAISECRLEISKANERLDELGKDREKLDRYRKLLYSSGDDLENVVADVLQKLGATNLDERHGVEDLLVKVGEETCVVEVTGTDGALKLLKVRQLLDHAMIVEEQTEERPKAILVANPLKTVPPNMRGKEKTPEFPSNVVTRAEETRIALVSGHWLFEKFCEFLDGNIEGAIILDEILSTDGLVG